MSQNYKYLYTIFVFFVLSAANSSSCAQNVLQLTSEGSTRYQIVIPKNKTPVEWDAAFLLKKYIDKVANVSIPVVYDYEASKENEILVGKTNRSDLIKTDFLAEDAIVIKIYKNKIYVAGGNSKGVLYSASTFLENYLGIRKYTKDLEVIPVNRNIRIPINIDVVYSPAFTFRTTYFEDSENKEYADWHKLNYFFENRVNFVHSFNQYLPDTLFKTHPEYFALVDGKRTPVQPCLSHPEVYKIIKANLQIEMAKYPKNKIWSVSQTDDSNYCHCNMCDPIHKKGNGFIETLLPFVNKIADDFPDKIISTLAYRQSIDPSKYVRPRKNVEIMLCYTHINRAIPLSTGLENAKMFRGITNGWRSQTNNIFIWDYVINYNHTLSPFPNLQVLQPNIQYIRDNKIKSIFAQGSGNQKSEFSELKSYLISKLLWNPDIDVKKAQNEFIDTFYFGAEAEMKQYIALLQEQVKKNNAIVDIWADPSLNKNDFLNRENITKYRNILNEALRKTKNNPGVYKRILKEKLGVDYAELQISKYNIERSETLRNSKDLEKKLSDFISEAKIADIKFLTNSENTPEEYKKNFLNKNK
jgi:hypothetical protein